LVAALLNEILLRKNYSGDENIETIYFGGGTPSLLQIEDVKNLIEKIKDLHAVDENAEITIETNPDDITTEKLEGWKNIGINRLSLGIQSFFEEDLKWMNRAHNAQQAMEGLKSAKKYFDNITIDLIYGTPILTNENWKRNIEIAIAENIPHLSCYALTVEPKTPLQKMIREHNGQDIDAGKQSEQFLLLMQWMNEAGYEHYEISNFAKPEYRSRHNSSYWQKKKYIGIGPSAHSFDGKSRQWNVSNNHIYIDSIMKGIVPHEKEMLTLVQQLNEYIMTSLRTSEGLDLNRIEESSHKSLRTLSRKYIKKGWMIETGDHLKLTNEGKLWADGIAADLFFEKADLKI
jgi:oxygen-independent coproporphyrinogen-3 oxidase